MSSPESETRPDESTDSETTNDEDLEAAGIDPDDLDARRTTIEAAPEPVDPLADDFEIGEPAIDTATGRSVVIVDRAADRTDDHSDAEGYDFLENYGNQRTRAREALGLEF